MNTTCDNQEMLLRQLTLQGDPTAFFSLCRDYIKERYLRERKSGVSHDDAQSRVATEASTSLEELQRIKPVQFDAWFDEHCTLLPASESDAEFEKEDPVVSSDAEQCLAFCSRALLRIGSDIARKKNRRKRSLSGRLFQHVITKIVLVVILLTGLFFLATVLLRHFKTSVAVSIISSSDTLKFQYPKLKNPEPDSIYFLPAISKDTVDTITADPDTVENEVTTSKQIQKKKAVSPKPRQKQYNAPPIVRKSKPAKTYSPAPGANASAAPVVSPVQAAPVSAPPPPPSTQSQVDPVPTEEPLPIGTEEPASDLPSEPASPEPVSPSSEIPDLM